jgi:UDP-glucose 4-epimerase
MMEMILKDFCYAYNMRGIALRYFNPIGADPKMRSGPFVKNASHVLAKLLEASKNPKEVFCITGVNWPTRDGTGLRDYIHVWDLAKAHVGAIERFDAIFNEKGTYYLPINLGTGKGVTVRELVTAFEKVIGKPVQKQETEARPGDVAGACANEDTAFRLLGWKAQLTIEQAIKDALKWNDLRDRVINYNI